MRLLLALLVAILLPGQVSAGDLAGLVREIAAEPSFQGLEGEAASEHMAARIREEYGGDEEALLGDAMALDLERDGSLLYGFWTELQLQPQSRIALVERLVASEDEEEQARSLFLLKLADRKQSAGAGGYEVDLSAHASWLNGAGDIPSEYLLYLFKQDGQKAWELLKPGGDPGSSLGQIADLLARKDSNFEKRKSWLAELKPGLSAMTGAMDIADACYLAWFLSRIYDSASLARENNPELFAKLEKSIPGLTGALLDGVRGNSGELQRTQPKEAAKWVAMMRLRAGLQRDPRRQSSGSIRARYERRGLPGPPSGNPAFDTGEKAGAISPWAFGGAGVLLAGATYVWLRRNHPKRRSSVNMK